MPHGERTLWLVYKSDANALSVLGTIHNQTGCFPPKQPSGEESALHPEPGQRAFLDGVEQRLGNQAREAGEQRATARAEQARSPLAAGDGLYLGVDIAEAVDQD